MMVRLLPTYRQSLSNKEIKLEDLSEINFAGLCKRLPILITSVWPAADYGVQAVSP